MELVYAHLCDYALVDQSNKVSIVGVFDVLHGPPGAVTPLPPCFLVASFTAPVTEGASHNVQLAFVDEDGRELVSRVTIPLRFVPSGPARPLGATLLARLGGIPFPKPGTYQVEFHAQSRRIGYVQVHVIERAASTGAE